MQSGKQIVVNQEHAWIATPPNNLYKCIQGLLNDSKILVVKECDLRCCTIILRSDCNNTIEKLDNQLRNNSHICSYTSKSATFHYRFHKNSIMADKFMERLAIISKVAPISNDILTEINSSLFTTNFLPILEFMKIMNKFSGFPKELTNLILISYIQSEGPDCKKMLQRKYRNGLSLFKFEIRSEKNDCDSKTPGFPSKQHC